MGPVQWAASRIYKGKAGDSLLELPEENRG